MASQEVGSDSLDPQDQELAETHHIADYSIVHPETRTGIAVFDSKNVWYLPKALRVINSFDIPDISRLKISAKLATKYLSFASEADFISYAHTVLPGIVGPAIDVMASDNYVEKIRQFDSTSFAWGANGGNEELNEHLSKLNRLALHCVLFSPGRVQCPADLMYFYMGHYQVRDWLNTFATLITEPKLLPSIRTGYLGFSAGLRIEIFILAHAVQIMLFAPIQGREDASYKSTDSYPRRFPLGYPEPGPDDVMICGKYSLDDLYRALLLIFFILQQRPGKDEDPHISQSSEVWLGYTTVRSHYPWNEAINPSSVKPFPFEKLPRELQLRIVDLATSPKVTPTIERREHRGKRTARKIQCTSEDSFLALKLSSRGMYHLVKTANPVVAIYDSVIIPPPGRVIFRMNLRVDTLRLFYDHDGLPKFYDAHGRRAPLPVRKLLSFSEYYNREFNQNHREPWWCQRPLCPISLNLHNLPMLEEYSLILPDADKKWMIEGLPRVRPQTDNETTAHIGTKWQFNYYRYYEAERLHTETPEGFPMGVPPNFCDDTHLDGPNPSDRPGSIPYIGRYGYERSKGIVGGHWAGFKYFHETQEVYFAPLSWDEVKPLAIGPYGKNGAEAFFHNHTPQFVAKVWIIRQGTTVPKGWVKVRDVGPSDPTWRHQVLMTWKQLCYTFHIIESSPSDYSYDLHQR
ncbi:uncharacterized protein BKA55DRAFT_686334 [Fusarium redolens]|uniref:Uncharacterized protein n=1 Tax=Fusarium redolens TaxID=48865 RepID=A0A9P9HQ47_FUSRE|nr:uncharacterized protein BKA55DRAFT_686334 [Fusarium redolens]KAH7260752.1 hypothetical protein BKA55DRAFT_686334 [Fusarium redolens]